VYLPVTLDIDDELGRDFSVTIDTDDCRWRVLSANTDGAGVEEPLAVLFLKTKESNVVFFGIAKTFMNHVS
jgi:hypothetical protein